MNSRRVLKAAEAIREVVGMAILTELQDPRIQDATVTFVEVSRDMRVAKVHVSVMGDETKQDLTIRGLQNAAGFLQQRIAQRIDTRYTPKLRFLLDRGVKNSLAVTKILEEVLPQDQDTAEATSNDSDESATDQRPKDWDESDPFQKHVRDVESSNTVPNTRDAANRAENQ